MAASDPKPEQEDSKGEKNPQSARETVESVVVAFILAFLFRAFVAEAFVIPTGSMAPTLMGAHKDLSCEHCGQTFQASASQEFDSNTGAVTNYKTIASTCANCRGLNVYDFRHNKNHASFSGDRILVSKFDYILSSPKRWDVFVFKWPLGARMNYIKRLIGLPGESLLLMQGDVYAKQEDDQEFAIARKPPHKIRAMKQVVSDTNHYANELVAQGWPSLWQPWSSGGDANGWSVALTEDQWSAELKAGTDEQWIRYYHKFVDIETWESILDGGKLGTVDPYQSQLITDYLAYNTPYTIVANDAFDLTEGMLSRIIPRRRSSTQPTGNRWVPKEEVPEDVMVMDYIRQNRNRITQGHASTRDGRNWTGVGHNNDGYHWVGDLSAEFDLNVESESGTLVLDLVEFGVHFRCTFDIESGEATLKALDGDQELAIFDGNTQLTSTTKLQGSGRYSVEFANFDDQLVLWVNGKVVEFDTAPVYDSHTFRAGTARRPYWTASDPLDAAPIGIGGQNVAMKVNRAQVYRDIYYIAIQTTDPYSDYDMSRRNTMNIINAVPDARVRAAIPSPEKAIEEIYKTPQWWEQTNLFAQRETREFELGEKEYFPMGDNSAASSDARAWYGHHYVEERYLLGKALLVFWPHAWNTPLPITPNFARMGMIR